jgi:predicted CoA-binding protein
MVLQKKKTIVLGASPNPMRYSYLAVNRLHANHHPVVAIGKREGSIADIPVIKEHPLFDDIHTITLYLNANNQKQYYDYIMSLHPKRIIFNPGAENPELVKMATAQGIQAIEACTLVMLSTGQY